MGAGARLGQRQPDEQTLQQCPGRDRLHQAIVQRRIPLTKMLGAGQRVVRVATDRARQAAFLPGARGWIAAVVRRSVGALEQGRRILGVLHYHHDGDRAAACRYRQPAIIDSDRFDDWLDPTSPVPWLLELVRTPCAGPYERRAVSTRVNSVQKGRSGHSGPQVGAGALLPGGENRRYLSRST